MMTKQQTLARATFEEEPTGSRREPEQPEILAYADRLFTSPGEAVSIHASTKHSYRAHLVRLSIDNEQSGDLPQPRSLAIPNSQDPQIVKGRIQAIHSGSCVAIKLPDHVAMPSEFTVALWMNATIPEHGDSRGIVSTVAEQTSGWHLSLDAKQRLSVGLGESGFSQDIEMADPIRPHCWYFVAVAFSTEQRFAEITRWAAMPFGRGLARPMTFRVPIDRVKSLWDTRMLMFGAGKIEVEDGKACFFRCFDGKLESPRLFSRVLDIQALERLGMSGVATDAFAEWDFARSIATNVVVDVGPHSLHGRTINRPTRAVTGHNWTGETEDFRRVPDQYRAIHFHSDDLDDAGWRADITIGVPDDLPSAIYAIEIRAENSVDLLPLFVSPRRQKHRSRTAILIPTFTYLAYANERIAAHSASSGRHSAREIRLSDDDLWLLAHPELGSSLYDRHLDGSGVCFSSRLRPILNLRPTYRNWCTHAPRHLGLDLFLAGWLDHLGVTYDVLTDEELHLTGPALLDGYSVVITGSHPEYATFRMLDALEHYVSRGGRLMYLGGNGLFAVASVDEGRPHAIEVRRGHAGSRPWESPAGESRSEIAGEVCGLWRHRGRPPNRLLGVGFSSVGYDEKAPGYRRLPDSFRTSAAWIFEGVRNDRFGDYGYVMGGASSDEVDRYEPNLGPPFDALHLATSCGHSAHYRLTLDELIQNTADVHGMNDERVRSDIVFFHTSDGGAVFSVGSVGWVGALPINSFDNDISRITENVLHGFLTITDLGKLNRSDFDLPGTN
jgi:N,N-dimethylformamidase